MKPAWFWQSLAVAGWFASAPALSADESSDPPEDAFLEFLGGFETADGEWVDPVALAELDTDERTARPDEVPAADGDEDHES